MNTNKMQVFVFAMLFVVGAFTGCVEDDDDESSTTTTDDGSGNETVVTTTTIKIGFLNPITGPLDADAAGFKWGVDQAIGDLNAHFASENTVFELSLIHI